MLRPLLVVLLALLACNSSTQKPADEPNAGNRRATGPAPAIPTSEYTPPPAATATAQASSNDAPEISRSAGSAGGAVVLWPRIVLPRGAGKPDAETRALAGKAEAHLADVARRALPGAAIDVRPEPERVCPKSGCQAVSLGILFARAGNGCSLVAMVSPPGASPARLVPWSPGSVKLAQASVGFREPPERAIKVDDYARCDALPGDLTQKDAEVEAAIRAAAGH